jgi:hypothetical protein
MYLILSNISIDQRHEAVEVLSREVCNKWLDPAKEREEERGISFV